MMAMALRIGSFHPVLPRDAVSPYMCLELSYTHVNYKCMHTFRTCVYHVQENI